VEVPSSTAIRRKLAQIAADTAILWYNADSATTGQLSVMAYVPSNKGYVTWYAGWQKRGDGWKIHELVNTSDVELGSLLRTGQANSVIS